MTTWLPWAKPNYELLHPEEIVIPKMTTTVRDIQLAEIGTLIYDTTQDKLCFSKTKSPGASNWEIVKEIIDYGSMVAWYKFDEGIGSTLTDTVEIIGDATAVNTAWGARNDGNCLIFNGTNAYINIPGSSCGSMNFDGSISFSMSCWVKTVIDGNPELGIIAGRDDDAANRRSWFWGYHKQTGSIYHMKGASLSWVTTPPTAGSWNLVTFTYNGSFTFAYLNGSITGSQANGSVSTCAGDVEIYIGRLSNNTSYFIGSIDDFRVWNNYCLTTIEVGSLYSGG